MSDKAHDETDRIISGLEKRIREEYTQAERELAKKCDDYFTAFDKRDKKKLADVKAGKITEAEYKEWRVRQMITGKRWLDMRDTINQDLTHTREIAKAIAYSKQFDVYALNHNWSTYDIESRTGIDTNYTLYDHDTVANLAKDGKILPPPGKKVSEAIRQGRAKRWTDKQISSVALQAVLQGESIPNMAKRIAETLGESERKAAVRTARTACTSAENAGRLDSYKRCESMGIKLKKQWLAAHDNRTRDWHRFLDGVRKPINEPFENDWGKIMYPGDPNAAGANVYNCRCTLISAINGHEIEGSEIYKNNHRDELEGVSWEEWKKEKNQDKKQIEEEDGAKPIRKRSNKKSPKLTEKEEHAVNSYISSDAYKINDRLRHGKELTQEEKDIVDNLDSALKKMPKYKGDLVRVVDFTAFPDRDKRTREFISKFKVGEPVTFDEYISTSKRSGYNDDANVQIFIKDSRKGRDISLYNSDEYEVLYERGSNFIAEEIKYKNGIYYILLKEE